MKICPNCSWENQEEFNFCLGCGNQLESAASDETQMEAEGVNMQNSEPKTEICTACGAEITPGHAFCGQCGTRVESRPQSSPTAGPDVLPQAPAPAPTPVVEEKLSRLVLLLPNGEEGGSYPLKGDSTQIGRNKGNILFLDDPYVSPLHATFYNDNGQLCVRNENSFNGLFLRLRQRVELQHNDIVLLGKQLLRFEQIEIQSEPASELTSSKTPVTPVWGSPYSSYWGRLVQLVAGGFEGNAILLGGNQVELGRERGQITFPGDRFISSLHARVVAENNRFFIEDVGSRNGTFVQVKSEHVLSDRDILIIGEQLLRVELNR